jgi:hypothetical protein
MKKRILELDFWGVEIITNEDIIRQNTDSFPFAKFKY